MAMSGGKDDGAPMMEMNMTPLIDVLLCLLIIFIMSIPMATHAVNIDLPQPSESQTQLVDPVINKLVLSPTGDIVWNGTTISQNELVGNLQQMLTFPVEPELQFQPDPNASYDLASKVLNIIKISGVTKFGFVGNEQFRSFSKG